MMPRRLLSRAIRHYSARVTLACRVDHRSQRAVARAMSAAVARYENERCTMREAR